MMNWGGKKAVYTVFIYEYMNKPSQCFYNTDLKTLHHLKAEVGYRTGDAKKVASLHVI